MSDSRLPDYLLKYYRWAYIAPMALRFWDHEGLVDLILFHQYRRLRDLARTALRQGPGGDLLQIACVYGSLSACLVDDLAPAARLHVVDVVPEQLRHLAAKLPAHAAVLHRNDSRYLAFADASFARVLIFFLLHEQPAAVRLATLREALRVLRHGGRLVIVDFHRPRRWHPLRPLQWLIFHLFEPFARDLWVQELIPLLRQIDPSLRIEQELICAGLYQSLIIDKP